VKTQGKRSETAAPANSVVIIVQKAQFLGEEHIRQYMMEETSPR
jgi:hypothetical protein